VSSVALQSLQQPKDEVDGSLIRDLVIIPPTYPTAAKRLYRGKDVVVKVLDVISPSQFWVQILSGEDYVRLPALHDEISEHYGALALKPGFTYVSSVNIVI